MTVSSPITVTGFSAETTCGPGSTTVVISSTYERNSNPSSVPPEVYSITAFDKTSANNYRAPGFSLPENEFTFTNANTVCPISLELDTTGDTTHTAAFGTAVTTTNGATTDASGTFTVTLDSNEYGTALTTAW